MADNNDNSNKGNPTPGGSGLNRQNVQQNQTAVQGNNNSAQLARPIQANTNVTMKTEVIKLPDFYRELGKDTITALEFMARIDECQVTKNGMTLQHSLTSASRFVVKRINGLAQLFAICNSRLHKKCGLKSDQFLKQNLLLSQMTSSSLTVWPSFRINQMRIPGCFSHDWRSSSMF
jgi:hypothetical protein